MAKKREIKIIANNANYTFLNADEVIVTSSSGPSKTNRKKDNLKNRPIDFKKSRKQRKNRITGGQRLQGHTSVYE
ncbi:MAG TPA: hypothetical protein VH415_11200 [Nitrososphaeraceae archaeon]|jgi:hypothetical protein